LAARGFTLPRGIRDTDSVEMNRRLWVYEKIRDVVRRYGFQMVEPATIENLTTLEAKSGPAIREEIYWFKDKAGRDLGLRFDLTVGLARMVANRSDLLEPIKLASIGGNWRYDEPQYGRYRYFTQWDVEIFGSESPFADAEVICIGADILSSVGLKDYTIRISNRKLTEAYLKQLGISSGEALEQCLRIIDKLRKVSSNQLQKEFDAAKIKKETVRHIISYISLNGPPENVLEKLREFTFREENAKKGVEELRILAHALVSLGRSGVCLYDLSIVRGIGYYDGIVFEAFGEGEEDLGSIFGGGRYDRLCKIYGKRDIPATGVAGGIERLMISLEHGNLFPTGTMGAKVFVATVREDQKHEAMKLVQRLRDNGIATELDLKARPLGKQLEYANAAKIPYLIVLGPQEVETQTLKLKEMVTRNEIQVSMDELVSRLKSLN
jgi:histidyl-tRNA synthetase